MSSRIPELPMVRIASPKGGPTKAESLLRENLAGISIFPDAESLTEFVAQTDRRARAIQSAGLVIIGMYDAHSRKILLSAEPWEDEFTVDIRARNLGHELGHAIDGPKKDFSQSPDWQRIFNQEIRASDLFGRPRLDPREAFAEVLSIILSVDDVAAVAELLGIPKAIQFMSERGLFDEA